MRPAFLIVGARPNLVKAAALVEAHRRRSPVWDLKLVHTGQHYDDRLSRCFFDQLGLPQPAFNLDIGSGSITVQTARILERLEAVFIQDRPSYVIVVGDVTSTLAAALAAKRMSIPVAHVEAGLRSFDDQMPEELNRRLTDVVSDLLFVTEHSGLANLRDEGIDAARVHFVGNPMIDTLLRHKERAVALRAHCALGLRPNEYVLVTLHRPSNVDSPDRLADIVAMLQAVARDRDVVFPAHPRTTSRLSDAGFSPRTIPRLRVIDPQPYLEFISLLATAGAVLTDSGGIQEETTALGIPCVTLRKSTERPVTTTAGTNVLVGEDAAAAVNQVRTAFGKRQTNHAMPDKWDGAAGIRIVDIVDRSVRSQVAQV